MSFEFFAVLTQKYKEDIQKLISLDSEVNTVKGREKRKKEKQAEAKRAEMVAKCNLHLCYHLLAIQGKSSANNLRSTWAKKNTLVDSFNRILERWNFLDAPLFDLSLLPLHSFTIQFTFKLAKPYISKDEQEFYIIDNPVRKDKVFGLPYVAPSSWKGSLRSALWQLGYKEKEDQIRKIFGNERAEEDESRFRKGRIHLYPTFFIKRSLEVINPHDREKRVGLRGPIYFESVPVDAEGTFSLLYIPFDLLGRDKLTTQYQVASDLKLITEGLQAMFTIYRFGAKTSSGFGSARPSLTDGKIILKAEGIKTGQKDEIELQLPEESFKKYLNEDGSVKEEFKGSGEAGLLSNSEYNEKRGSGREGVFLSSKNSDVGIASMLSNGKSTFKSKRLQNLNGLPGALIASMSY